MAWILEHTAPGAVDGYCETIGSVAYYSSSATNKAYSWDGAAEVEIHNSHAPQLCAHGGELFRGEMYAVGMFEYRCRVYRMDAPGSWTLVRTTDNYDTASTYVSPTLKSAPSGLLFMETGRLDTAAEEFVNSSANGAVWSIETITPATIVGRMAVVDGFTYLPLNDSTGIGAHYFYVRNDDTGVWAASSIELDTAGYSWWTGYGHYGNTHNNLYVRRTADNQIMRSIDGGATWSATDLASAATGIYGCGMYDFVVVGGSVYYLAPNSDNWTLLEAAPAGITSTIFTWKGRYYIWAGANLYYNDTLAPVSDAYTAIIAGVNMDIDANGMYLYLGLLSSGLPVCVKFPATLNADGTKVYEPGAGNYIEVACGRQDADRVWVCGNFGTPKLRLSEDAGGTWTTIDDAWAGVNYVRPMWPWALMDAGITVMTHDAQDAYQTPDDGTAWTQLQAALPFVVGAFDILPINPVESVIGNYAPGVNRVNLSINNFATFYDITAGTPNARVTKVIVG